MKSVPLAETVASLPKGRKTARIVPVHVNLPGILLADVAAFAGILLLLLIPTLFISKVDPAKTVKAE